jgi:opacity protein-like surface antigen
MKFKTFASVAAAAAVLSVSAVSFAGGPAVYAEPASMGHFYAEGNLGVFNATHEVTFSSTDSATPPVTTTYLAHGLQNSASFGGGFGYGFTTARHMYLGIDLNAAITPADAQITFDNNSFKSELNYKFNLNLNPGVMINHSTLMYAVIGGSYANYKLTQTYTANLDATPTSKAVNSHAWGFVFGGGLRHAVTQTVSVFGEYNNFHYADQKNVTKITVTDTNTYSADKLSINGSSYKVGVLVNFF